MMPVIYLLRRSPYGSSILPSIVLLGRAILRRWYTRTCSPQMEQPDDHPSTGGLLHHLLTLAITAVVFFFRHQLSPTASTFRSGAPYAARTFLSCPVLDEVFGTSDKPRHCSPRTKVQNIAQKTKENLFFFQISTIITTCA